MSNLKEIINSCGDATIVAATKYVDTSVMEELLANGINNFGENRVDSFLEKYDKLTSKKQLSGVSRYLSIQLANLTLFKE